MESSLSFYRDGEVFLSDTQIRLLKQVLKEGSIHAAVKTLKMSYQHAWHMLDKINKLSPLPVVIRKKGGKDGGGCNISPYGIKLIRVFEEKNEALRAFLEESSGEFKSCFF